jgi:hypothetical protein
MMLRDLLVFSVLSCGILTAGLTEDKVAMHFQSHSLACNSGKLDAILESVPDAGLELVWTESKERGRFDRKEMKAILDAFYASIDPATYVYGVQIESIVLNEDGSAVVAVSISEAFRHKESGELRSTRYQEKLTMLEENGRVVVAKAEMSPRQVTKFSAPPE